MNLHTQLQAEQRIGVEFSSLEQGTSDWHFVRAGVITGTNANTLLNGTKRGKVGLIKKIVSEIIIDKPDVEDFQSASMIWGKTYEDAAVSGYTMGRDYTIEKVGFVFRDSTLRTGCSPDGINTDKRIIVEIKCPTTRVFLDALLGESIDNKWVSQCQFNLWCLDYDYIDLVIYDPRVVRKKIVVKRYERNLDVSLLIEEAVEEINYQVDEILSHLGYRFGNQWDDNVDVMNQ